MYVCWKFIDSLDCIPTLNMCVSLRFCVSALVKR